MRFFPPADFCLCVPLELSKANQKSKSVCISPHPIKEHDGSKHQVVAKHQAVSATAGRDGKKHKESVARANGSSLHASKRHIPSRKAASSREKSENQSQSINSNISHCEETPVCAQNSNFTNGSTKNSRQCEAALKDNPQPLKAKSKELNAERWSPAGSSRPGSAKAGNVNIRRDTVRAAAVTPTNKSANEDSARKACLSLLNGGRTTRFVPNRLPVGTVSRDHTRLGRPALTAARHAEEPLGSLQHRSTNIELVPVAIRVQIIQQERARKELFRRKNCAAAIIQRAWRR